MNALFASIQQRKEDESDVTDANAVDVSLSHRIKCVETHPMTPTDLGYNRRISAMYHPAEDHIFQFHHQKKIETDQYLIFNMGGVLIDSFDIRIIASVKTVKVYTSSNKDSWSLIKTKTDIQRNTTSKLILKSEHKDFIKIELCDRPQDNFYMQISKLQWNGFDNIFGEVTNKIKVFQCSDTDKESNINRIFPGDDAPWKHAGGTNCFFTFDCGNIEIDKIVVQFSKMSKPQTIQIRLSDVPNSYSFKESAIQQWKFKTSKHLMSSIWDKISLEEIFDLSQNGIDLYKDGFKRYLRIDFMNYINAKLNISSVRFFGHESKQIPNDSEQFDPVLDVREEKTETKTETVEKQKHVPLKIYKRPMDDSSDEEKDSEIKINQYKPKIIGHTPSNPAHPIENLWKDGLDTWWETESQAKNRNKSLPYLVIDLGNNNVDTVIVMPDIWNTCKICKIYTGVFGKWTLLFEDKNVSDKLDVGCRFEITGKHAKCIKIEFDGMNDHYRRILGLNEIFIYGKDTFITEEPKQITWDDMNAMDDTNINEELVEKFRKQELRKQTIIRSIRHRKIRGMEWKRHRPRSGQVSIGKLSKEWITLQTEQIKSFENSILNRKIESKLSKTVFEEKEMFQICEKQKLIADQYVPKLVNFYTETETKRVELANIWVKDPIAKRRNHSNHYVHKCATKRALEEHEKNMKDSRAVLGHERNVEVRSIQVDSTKEAVFEKWKESVEKHPLQISDEYNVMDYDAMILYAQNHRNDEMKILWSKLADLMDESLEKRQELMHKYHVFKLSQYYYEARSPQYGRPHVFALFDCKTYYAIDRLEFEIKKNSYFNKIQVYTADTIQEQKIDNSDTYDTQIHTYNEDMEKVIDYSN
eukprot:549867_1